MKIAIFGGSFNPIHYGHLILAETARCNFNLDRIIFIPAGKPPHKPDIPLAEDKQRLQMIKIAISGNPAFGVSDYEIRKRGMSYTYDTIKHFRENVMKKKNEIASPAPGRARNDTGNELFFIMGIDLLGEIHTWKKSEGLLDLCTFLVGTRPGFRVSQIPKRIRSKVRIFKIPSINISGTYIRRALREKKTIKYLLPEKVERYIYKNKIYISK